MEGCDDDRKSYNLKGTVAMWNIFGVNYVYPWTGPATHNNVINVTEKWQKQNWIITKICSQITLLCHNSYGNAQIRSYTGGLLLLYQPMHQSNNCVTLF